MCVLEGVLCECGDFLCSISLMHDSAMLLLFL